MSKLMSGFSNYTLLREKYKGFVAPTVRIKVDGEEITKTKKTKVMGMEVSLTSNLSASSCSFDIIEEYDTESSKFSSDSAFSKIQLGAKVDIKIGYVTTETVFKGMVYEIEYIMGESNTPIIHVECMDAKCILMKQSRVEIATEKTMTAVIDGLLKGSPFSTYTGSLKSTPSTKKEDMIPVLNETDYNFIIRFAEKHDFEFFIICGDVYFRKTPLVSESIMTLEPKKGLLSARLRLSGSQLYNEVEVVGINPENNKEVRGSKTISGTFSKGASADKMLGSSKKVFFDQGSEDISEAKDLAENYMKKAQSSFGKLTAEAIGIPEIVPGRTIAVKGVIADIPMKCYITSVKHKIDSEGYVTLFEGRIKSL